MNAITHEIDRTARRLVIRFNGDVDGHAIHAALARLWQDVPDIASHDSICDMRHYIGNISHDDIRSIAEAWRLFSDGDSHARRTAVVTLDRFASFYIKAIALLFSGRELAVFRTLENAHHWLDRRA